MKCALDLIDSEFYPTPIEDLMLAKEFIARNDKLIKDYPSLEDALKLLNHVIESEQSSPPCKA